jgi:hypothetical protein
MGKQKAKRDRRFGPRVYRFGRWLSRRSKRDPMRWAVDMLVEGRARDEEQAKAKQDVGHQ